MPVCFDYPERAKICRVLFEPSNPTFDGDRLGIRGDKARWNRRVVDFDYPRQIIPFCDAMGKWHIRRSLVVR
jgi:hypothetical protein